MESSSTSSPFSTRSTIPSSPEFASSSGGDNAAGKSNQHPSFQSSPGHFMQGMQALLNNISTFPFNTDFLRQAAAAAPDVKPNVNDVKPALPAQVVQAQNQRQPTSTSGSTHGGSRTEPPKRAIEVDELQTATPSPEELAQSYNSGRNRLLLQGDPQNIHKQRVETAIRVIIDILRTVPPSPSLALPAGISTIVPRDAAGNILANFERIATFKGLRLQVGTTTKTSSKKQLQAGAIPTNQLAFVETAVYMSGENGKRVYACKRCRSREERRRQNKDAARKKQLTETEPVPPPKPKKSMHPPSEDYITGENSSQYDPHRMGQVVEEPPWDPTVPDWRHEIVLFNSPPDVPCKEGFWLPFRVICYCKCHGEKVGFRIKFTLRTFDGRIIATEMTHPIKITDDHKTDAKSKPRLSLATGGQAQAPRARKGRMSTASSQRVSPAPSESEVSVTSEVGAVVQKQTPQVRQGKPYERPPSQSPAVQTSNLPFDFMNERPRLSRQQSTSSSYASQADISNWTPDAIQQNTVSPDALRRPNFGSLTPLTSLNNSMSANSSVAPSPAQTYGNMNLGNGMGTDLYGNELTMSSASTPLDLSSLSSGMPSVNNMMFPNAPAQPSRSNTGNTDDIDMNHVANELDKMLFSGSSQASVASSFHDDSSVFSGFTQGSVFSDSGLPPDSALDDMIDYSGGESTGALSPMQHLNLSPNVGMGQLDLSGVTGVPNHLNHANHVNPANQVNQSPFAQGGGLPNVAPNMNDADAHTRALLALLAQQQAQQQPVPVVSHVIPAEGDMAGGTPVAIAGRLFTPETVICFGGRPAVTSFVTDSFLQCTLPPSPVPGEVEVSVQGYTRDLTQPAMMFKYLGMDKEMMRLMLEVRQMHQSTSDPAVRLVDHIVRSNHNSDISDRSSMSPAPNGSSPFDASAAPTDSAKPMQRTPSPMGPKDLQTTLISFLEALDEQSPGSLRRSGVVNHRNKAQQTLLHLATVMGFNRLLRRLILVGGHLDLQDVNGFTPLAFAALCGQTGCARVLLEAGASYDLSTNLGELPLDLAKIAEHRSMEEILLSAVWSTATVPHEETPSVVSIEVDSEIDDDNPSSESDGDADSITPINRLLRPRRFRRRSKGKQKASLDSKGRTSSRRISPDATPQPSSTPAPHEHDDPPPYAPPDHQSSWMSRTLSNISHPSIPGAVWHHLPSLWGSEKGGVVPPGWIAFPAPSWDTLQKVTSPEDIKLFTQAMAAAALNAVVQSGATTSNMDENAPSQRTPVKQRKHQRRASGDSQSSGRLSASEVVRQVKQDRMLYLFWLPVLLFVGFWLLVTALPIATGFCLIYARQISRAIKQRL